MVKIKKKLDNSKLHWFWKITTKWWFFPLSPFLMSFLYLIIFNRDYLFYYDLSWALWVTFGLSFFFIPAGIAYFIMLFIELITGWSNLSLLAMFIVILTSAIFYVYFTVSIFKIVKSKNKENKILKKRIIILLLLILLSFIGIFLSRYYPINASFL